MTAFLRSLTPPDPFQADLNAWRAWLARVSVLCITAGLIGIAPLAVFLRPFSVLGLLLYALMIAAGLLTLAWIRRSPQAAGSGEAMMIFYWLIALWLFLLLEVIAAGGVRSPYMTTFVLLVIIAGLLLNGRRFIRYALLGLGSITLLMLVDLTGVSPGAWGVAYDNSALYYWIGSLFNLALAGLLLYLYGRTIRFNLDRSQRQLLEQRAAESALRQNQERYRNFIEHSFEGVWLVEFDQPVPTGLPAEEQVARILAGGYVSECNQAQAQMTGFTYRSELLGRRLTELFGDPADPQVTAALDDMVRSGYRQVEREIAKLNIVQPDQLYLVSTIGVVEDAGLVELWISQRDITSRRTLLSALQRRTDQFTTLHQIAGAISSLKDLNGALMEVLSRLREALPLDAFYVALYDEAQNQIHLPLVYDAGAFWASPRPIVPPSWLAQVLAERAPRRWNRTPEEIEARRASEPLLIGDVQKISASLLVAPLQVGARLIGVISVQSYTLDAYDELHLEFLSLASQGVAAAIDNASLYENLQHELRERIRAETALQQLNLELEQRVESRTAQLESAIHELEAFSYSVSHDLRAPLRAIDGYSRFLLEDYADRLDTEGLFFLENVRKSAQRMGTLIGDLLNLSRVSRLELHVHPVDVSELVEDIFTALRQRDPARQIETQVEPGLMVTADPQLLRLALENLLDNAWKFTGRTDQPRIEFGSIHHNGRPAYYLRDNGAGFDMRYEAKLFKPFSRLHGIEEFDGTGIGLANVKRVIERHGGDLWAEGAVGQGASFFFTLPDPPG